MTVATNAAFSVHCSHIAIDVPCGSAVCLLVIRVNCVQTAHPIAMKFGGMVRIGPGQGESTVRPGKQVYLTFSWLKWNTMTDMLGDMAETLVTDYFTLLKLGQVHQCLNPTVPQKTPMDRMKIDAYGH